jgi:hypothetical protein
MIPVGARMLLWLHPPKVPAGTPRVLQLRGEVRWHNDRPPQGFGLAFRNLGLTEEIALHACFTLAHKVV